jgi:hypothetical protein
MPNRLVECGKVNGYGPVKSGNVFAIWLAGRIELPFSKKIAANDGTSQINQVL